MEDFELNSRLGIGNGEVRFKFRRLESGMEEFEPCSDVWNREWKSSSQVRCLEWKWRRSSQVPTLGIGNGIVRAKFEAWNRKWRISSQIPTLGIGNGGIQS